ncbi:MAG: ATP phosphoribosyltransferase regulatory subunit [Lachnospiraceae bacterium]|nr:ATP phosphoribosyltransferase regulatory subunit [Lachnospiraceae bacterium]
MKILHTPDGVQDIYDQDYEKKVSVEDAIHRVFKEHNYRDIQTPTFEFLNIFGNEIGTTPSKDLYKFSDRDGEILALRSDFTPAVARCAAKYFMEDADIIRFTYKGNTFSQTSELQGKLKETTQMGVELIGDSSIEADAEVIRLAIDALVRSGLKTFKLTIGNIDFFKGLCLQFGLTTQQEYTLRDYINSKKYFEAEEYLKECNISSEDMDIILGLEDLYGGLDVLDKAGSLISNDESVKAVNHLKALYDILKDGGYTDYITFDLSMVNKYRYYTGMVFRAYTYGVGDCILKGGRYDNLLAKFGKDSAAIGFVILIDDLLQALKNADNAGDDYITFALTKGRLADKTLSLLESIGITCEEMKDKDTRKLIFVNEDLKLKFFLSKGPDVPTYVEYGAADIGVVGEDTILEEDRSIYEVLDLNFGKCRMCVCGPAEASELLKHHEKIRVCTKYPKIAKDYFYNKKAQTVELIKLNGSVELGPIVGLGDVIVDIVETGSTLRENGLTVLEEICPLSARVVVNKVSMQMQATRIRELIAKLKTVIPE